MATWKEVALIYGPLHIGKGVERLLPYVDTYFPTGLLGQKASTWIVVAVTVAVPLIAVKWAYKLKSPWDVVALGVAGFLSTGLWDVVLGMITPAAARYHPGVWSAVPMSPPMAVAPPPSIPGMGKYRAT